MHAHGSIEAGTCVEDRPLGLAEHEEKGEERAQVSLLGRNTSSSDILSASEWRFGNHLAGYASGTSTS